MNEFNRPEQDEQIEAPEELIEALAELDNEHIFVPPSVDGAIMAAARKHLNAGQGGALLAGPQSGTPPRSNIIAWSGWGVAIAASVVLMISLTGPNPQTRQADQAPEPQETAELAAAEAAGASAPTETEAMTAAPAAKAAFAREDVNRDNTVDILDAFALARQIEGAQVVPAAYDFNNDGIIDRAEVDWVARVSVKL